MNAYWNSRYDQTEQSKLGWYESQSQPSLTLIQSCQVPKDVLIVDIGSGSSVLIDNLIEDGYTNLVATDISDSGLAITRKRLGERAKNVQFIVDDLTHPTQLLNLKEVSIWHDRAVFHFFIREEDRQTYRNLLNSVLKSDGFVIISTFAIGGLTQCSGLEIRQYSAETLSEFLGADFKCIQSHDHFYTTTWGQVRPFIYAVFQKIK